MRRALALCILLSSRIYVLPELRNCKTPVICGGKPGWADLEALNKACKQEKCEKDEEIQKLTDQVLRLQKQLEVLKSEIEALKTTTAPTSTVSDYSTAVAATTGDMTAADSGPDNLTDTCGVEYGGKCFWALFGGSTTFDLEKSKKKCTNYGGIPAGIYSNELMDKLHSYLLTIRDRKRGLNFAIWTGLTADPANSSRWYQPNGSLAPALRKSQDDRCKSGTVVVLSIKTSAENSGVEAGTEKCKIFGALCEKSKGSQPVHSTILPLDY